MPSANIQRILATIGASPPVFPRSVPHFAQAGDYNALIEALRAPGPGHISPKPGTPLPQPSDKNALRQLKRRRERVGKKVRRVLGLER